jgi:hypothetical protein
MNLTSHDYNDDVGVVDAVAAPHPAHSKSTITRPSSSLDMTNFGLHLAMELLGPARVKEHIELHQILLRLKHVFHRGLFIFLHYIGVPGYLFQRNWRLTKQHLLPLLMQRNNADCGFGKH